MINDAKIWFYFDCKKKRFYIKKPSCADFKKA